MVICKICIPRTACSWMDCLLQMAWRLNHSCWAEHTGIICSDVLMPMDGGKLEVVGGKTYAACLVAFSMSLRHRNGKPPAIPAESFRQKFLLVPLKVDFYRPTSEFQSRDQHAAFSVNFTLSLEC